MLKSEMAEKLAKARRLPYVAEFRSFMRQMQGLSDDDFRGPVDGIKDKIRAAAETDPVVMFERIMNEAASEWDRPRPMPANIDWHHFVVPGVLVAALRNNGYDFTDKDVDEAMARGEKLLGGACGFAGVCGGAYGAGIAASIALRATPIHGPERSELIAFTSRVLARIAETPRRCCRRSAYIALNETVAFLRARGFDRLPAASAVCSWSSRNHFCYGPECPFHHRHLAERSGEETA